MPSFEHELLVAILREHPDVVLALLRSVFDVDDASDVEVLPSSENLTESSAPERRADLVVVQRRTGEAQPRRALVIEVQLQPDVRKRFAWPMYIVAARARWRCPVTLVVVALDEVTARWCAAPIQLDENDSRLCPLVLGPGRVPVADHAVALRHPELAVLSLLAHRDEPSALQIGRAVLSACEHLDQDRAELYADIVMGFIHEAARRTLEVEMNLQNYEVRSEYLRKLKAEGRAEGRAEGLGRAVLEVLEARGLSVTDEQREMVTRCADVDTLLAWLQRAVTASRPDELFA